jgi:hypothetical protein
VIYLSVQPFTCRAPVTQLAGVAAFCASPIKGVTVNGLLTGGASAGQRLWLLWHGLGCNSAAICRTFQWMQLWWWGAVSARRVSAGCMRSGGRRIRSSHVHLVCSCACCVVCLAAQLAKSIMHSCLKLLLQVASTARLLFAFSAPSPMWMQGVACRVLQWCAGR